VILLSLAVVNTAQAALPSTFTFEDPIGDAIYANYVGPSETDYEISNFSDFFADIVSVGYTLDRALQQLTFTISFTDVPIVDSNAYYTMNMEFERGTDRIAFRTFYGEPGFADRVSVASVDIYTFFDNQIGGEIQATDVTVLENSINWVFIPTTLEDLSANFDDPDLELVKVSAESEYALNGSRLFAEEGDYYEDNFFLTSFDFSGLITNTDLILGLFDPLALFAYFGIPFLWIVFKVIRRLQE
jgi:hypothetical protein